MISGGAKFFTKSKCLRKDGASITATNSDASASRMIDRNPFTFYRSVASSDMDTITIVLTLPGATSFNRLLLVDHNWKDFNVKWLSGATFVAFTNVVGIDGALSGIVETTFADDCAYYEFDTVTTTQVQIQVTKTQIADAQKYINQLIVCSELGTLQGYPQIKGLTLDRNTRTQTMLSGKSLNAKSEEDFKCSFEFNDYPASLSNDIDLMSYLYNSEDNFQLWICGGRRGSTYFKKQMMGYRLKDIFTVQAPKPIKLIYSGNVFKNSVNFTVEFMEAVD